MVFNRRLKKREMRLKEIYKGGTEAVFELPCQPLYGILNFKWDV